MGPPTQVESNNFVVGKLAKLLFLSLCTLLVFETICTTKLANINKVKSDMTWHTLTNQRNVYKLLFHLQNYFEPPSIILLCGILALISRMCVLSDH